MDFYRSLASEALADTSDASEVDQEEMDKMMADMDSLDAQLFGSEALKSSLTTSQVPLTVPIPRSTPIPSPQVQSRINNSGPQTKSRLLAELFGDSETASKHDDEGDKKSTYYKSVNDAVPAETPISYIAIPAVVPAEVPTVLAGSTNVLSESSAYLPTQPRSRRRQLPQRADPEELWTSFLQTGSSRASPALQNKGWPQDDVFLEPKISDHFDEKPKPKILDVMKTEILPTTQPEVQKDFWSESLKSYPEVSRKESIPDLSHVDVLLEPEMESKMENQVNKKMEGVKSVEMISNISNFVDEKSEASSLKGPDSSSLLTMLPQAPIHSPPMKSNSSLHNSVPHPQLPSLSQTQINALVAQVLESLVPQLKKVQDNSNSSLEEVRSNLLSRTNELEHKLEESVQREAKLQEKLQDLERQLNSEKMARESVEMLDSQAREHFRQEMISLQNSMSNLQHQLQHSLDKQEVQHVQLQTQTQQFNSSLATAREQASRNYTAMSEHTTRNYSALSDRLSGLEDSCLVERICALEGSSQQKHTDPRTRVLERRLCALEIACKVLPTTPNWEQLWESRLEDVEGRMLGRLGDISKQNSRQSVWHQQQLRDLSQLMEERSWSLHAQLQAKRPGPCLEAQILEEELRVVKKEVETLRKNVGDPGKRDIRVSALEEEFSRLSRLAERLCSVMGAWQSRQKSAARAEEASLQSLHERFNLTMIEMNIAQSFNK